MSSLILQTATKLLRPVLLLFSIILLLRGHDEPGGGFVGGLVAAASFSLYAIAYDVDAARRALHVDPRVLIGSGLMIALLSGLPALQRGQPFLTSQWGRLPLPGVGGLELGTPLLFEIGVYAVVLGVASSIVILLLEE